MSEPPARRFPYSVPEGTLDELDSLPRLPLTLSYRGQRVETIGLIDSGATVNVLPYRVGLALGALWSAQRATLRLAGNLAHGVHYVFLTGAIRWSKSMAETHRNVTIFDIFLLPATRENRSVRIT